MLKNTLSTFAIHMNEWQKRTVRHSGEGPLNFFGESRPLLIYNRWKRKVKEVKMQQNFLATNQDLDQEVMELQKP